MDIFELIIDFFKKIGEIDGVVAAIVTGISTFLVTKYTYHKNIPLDKLEKAYNRVYYPIYRLIKSEESTDNIAKKSEVYLIKYAKYVDVSTLKAFKYLKESLGSKSESKAYLNFKNNIYAFDTKLRRRLGYMESNVFTMYTYSSPSDKRMIRLVLEVSAIYLPVFIMSYVSDQKIINSLAGISVSFIFVIIIEFGIIVTIFIKSKVTKLFLFLKNIILKFGSVKKEKNVVKSRERRGEHKK